MRVIRWHKLYVYARAEVEKKEKGIKRTEAAEEAFDDDFFLLELKRGAAVLSRRARGKHRKTLPFISTDKRVQRDA